MGIFQNPTVISILAFIFILGAAVTLHEFGHFIVAKLLKIRVETFSFGFGPRLFGWKLGTTDYRISLVPLGGYVKLGGDAAQQQLAAPVENTLFFAGEVTDFTGHHGTVHGAIASGHRAAAEILKA